MPKVADNPYVIPGKHPGSHLIDLQKSWRAIRKRARLPDVRIHDLRYTFASVEATNGLSLPMIGTLLGNSHASTTARYAHLADTPIQQASNLIGSRIGDALTNVKMMAEE